MRIYVKDRPGGMVYLYATVFAYGIVIYQLLDFHQFQLYEERRRIFRLMIHFGVIHTIRNNVKANTYVAMERKLSMDLGL